jgi:hypothetical protein
MKLGSGSETRGSLEDNIVLLPSCRRWRWAGTEVGYAACTTRAIRLGSRFTLTTPAAVIILVLRVDLNIPKLDAFYRLTSIMFVELAVSWRASYAIECSTGRKASRSLSRKSISSPLVLVLIKPDCRWGLRNMDTDAMPLANGKLSNVETYLYYDSINRHLQGHTFSFRVMNYICLHSYRCSTHRG